MFYSLFPFLHPTFPFAHYRFSPSLSNSLLLHSPTLRSSPCTFLSSTSHSPPAMTSHILYSLFYFFTTLLMFYLHLQICFFPTFSFLPSPPLSSSSPHRFLSLPTPVYVPMTSPLPAVLQFHSFRSPHTIRYRSVLLSVWSMGSANSIDFSTLMTATFMPSLGECFSYLAFAWWTQRSPSTTR